VLFSTSKIEDQNGHINCHPNAPGSNISCHPNFP